MTCDCTGYILWTMVGTSFVWIGVFAIVSLVYLRRKEKRSNATALEQEASLSPRRLGRDAQGHSYYRSGRDGASPCPPDGSRDGQQRDLRGNAVPVVDQTGRRTWCSARDLRLPHLRDLFQPRLQHNGSHRNTADVGESLTIIIRPDWNDDAGNSRKPK